MRRLAVVLVVAACAPPKPTPIIPDPVMKLPPVAVPASVASLDEAAVKAKSHAFFDAYDRHDLPAFLADLGPTFVLFQNERFVDAALWQKIFDDAIARHVPVRSRTWSDEHVFVDRETAVFVGRAVEKLPADAEHAAYDRDGYNTLVWVRAGDRWQIAHWQWTHSGLDAERDRWNEILKAGRGFNPKPNQLLVDTVKGKKPGTALDINTGQGRNAVFLATQGWKVTGVDIADEGLKIAAEAAAKLKVKLETVQSDIAKYDLGKDRWDLVTLIYAGADTELVKRVIPSLRKGGLFVCEYFHADSEIAKTGAGGWQTGALAALFKDGFTILRDDVVEDNGDWGQRKTKLVRFVAQKR